jgi:serine/threonine-protein kinase RsbW
MKRPSNRSHDFLLEIKLRSHPSLLCVLRGAMEPLMGVLGFSEKERRSIIRAIDEAVSNIMRHSYNGRLDRPIEVSCRSLRRRSNGKGGPGVEFLLFDRGPAVDPTKLCGRPLDEVRCGGLGLHLIRGGMDRVEYRRTANINRLRLIKYARSSKRRSNR